MDDIFIYMKLLIQAIKDSKEYTLYKRAEAHLCENSQLMQRVEAFSRASFQLHSQQDSRQTLEGIAQLEDESRALRKIPRVNAYLQAELDLCRLLQYISLEINGEIDIRIPPGIETAQE